MTQSGFLWMCIQNWSILSILKILYIIFSSHFNVVSEAENCLFYAKEQIFFSFLFFLSFFFLRKKKLTCIFCVYLRNFCVTFIEGSGCVFQHMPCIRWLSLSLSLQVEAATAALPPLFQPCFEKGARGWSPGEALSMTDA